MNAGFKSLLAVGMVAALAALPGTSGAQEEMITEGGYVVGLFPQGDWAEVAGFGLGADGTTYVRRDPTRLLNLRSSLGWGYNFERVAGVPAANLAGGDVLELETSNTSLFFGIGPELGKASGEMRGFVFGMVGLNVYWTNSHLKGTAGGQGYDANVGHTSTVFAWSAGAGIRRQMSGVPGGKIELSAEFRSGIGVEYVIPGEVTSAGGNVSWDRKTHDSNQILVRLGTVFGSEL